jgi:hypothetical protein
MSTYALRTSGGLCLALAALGCDSSAPAAAPPAPVRAADAGAAPIGSGSAGVAARASNTSSAGAGAGGQSAAAGRPADGSSAAGAGTISAGAGASAADGGVKSSVDPTDIDGGPVAGESRPRCETSPDQVILVGDSYMNWITHTFPEDLADAAGETWRMYAAGGCALASPGICLGLEIPDQLNQAIADDPDIVAMIMTGGGNDILISDPLQFPGGDDCKNNADSPNIQVCQNIIASALDAASKMFDVAADANIHDVLYFFYPHIPGGGAFAGEDPNAILDYAFPMVRDLCTNTLTRTQGRLRCHFLDLIPVFDGHPDWFADDNIHPNSMGSAAMAQAVVAALKQDCIAQPASSGCCDP